MRYAPLLLALFATPALGRAPPGTDTTSPEHAWWMCQKPNEGNLPCCSEADGHVLKDSDWRMIDGSYQIRVGNKWWQVPAETVINETKKCGPEPNQVTRSSAKVWYYFTRDTDNAIVDVHVRCFEAGTEY